MMPGQIADTPMPWSASSARRHSVSISTADLLVYELMCKASGLAYPVRDGIPVMLEEEARTMEDDELRSL